MAIDYAKVLKSIGIDFQVVGRGSASAEAFTRATSCEVVEGGIRKYIDRESQPPGYAIVAVGVESLCDVTTQLLKWGVKYILVEKPAGLTKAEIAGVNLLSAERNAKVFVAYNRRFYSSVISAQEIIEADGGVISFSFEFTEWSHVIETIKKAPGVKEKWVLANSSHVIDLAFYLGGRPKVLSPLTSGGLSWHPAASRFCGAGVSEKGALFSYHANWESAGTWRLEISTRSRRLLFHPLETLKVQKKGSTAIENIDCLSELDKSYKPGLYLQVESFLSGDNAKLCSISEHAIIIDRYYEIAGY